MRSEKSGNVGLLLALLGIGSVLLYLIQQALRSRHKYREPPYISSKIPLFRHLIGLFRKRHDSFVSFFPISKNEIYAFYISGMLGRGVYVVKLPRIRNTLLRSPTKVSARRGRHYVYTKVLAHYQIVGEEVSFYLKEGIANVHSTMRPGEALAHASLLLAQNLTVTVEGLAQNNASINLESWIAAPMTEAATLAIFGPKNP